MLSHTRWSKKKEVAVKNRVFFYIILVITAILAYLVLQPYVILTLMAFVTVLVFAPIYRLLYRTLWNSSFLATLLSVIFVLIVIVVPAIILINVTVNQAQTFIHDIQKYIEGNPVSMDTVVNEVNRILKQLPFATTTVDPQSLRNLLQNSLGPVLSAGGTFAVEATKALAGSIPSIFIYLILLVTFFPNKEKIFNTLRKLSPLSDEIDDMYIKRFTSISQSMVRGSVVVALAQLIPTFIMFTVFNVSYATFWSIMHFLLH